MHSFAASFGQLRHDKTYQRSQDLSGATPPGFANSRNWISSWCGQEGLEDLSLEGPHVSEQANSRGVEETFKIKQKRVSAGGVQDGSSLFNCDATRSLSWVESRDSSCDRETDKCKEGSVLGRVLKFLGNTPEYGGKRKLMILRIYSLPGTIPGALHKW